VTSLDKDIPPRNNRKAGPAKGRPTAVDKKKPHAGLYAPIRPDRYREKRSLSADQRKNPLLRMAYHRLSQIGELRGKYLRELDTIHGGRRTRSEKFAALARSSEQMLLRMDLATGVLGWLDVERGQYFLNTQCNIAEDCGMSPSSFNRLLHSMQLADYVYLRTERVRLEEKDEAGLNLVRTRVLVRFTEKFFADLGVRWLWHRAKKAAIKKRERELRQIGDMRVARQERASLEELRRQESRANWERSQRRETAHSQLQAVNVHEGRHGHPEPPREPDRGPMTPDQLMASVLAKNGKTPPSK
jgi:hypothetical protein